MIFHCLLAIPHIMSSFVVWICPEIKVKAKKSSITDMIWDNWGFDPLDLEVSHFQRSPILGGKTIKNGR